MAERKSGSIVNWQVLSPILSIFRLAPEKGESFPAYKAGQYIALRRDDCKLKRKVVDANGTARYLPDLDEDGNPKRGSVTHSYSIASAPYETQQSGYLEFYIILQQDETGEMGRLTESLFRVHLENDNQVIYVDRIAGDFTLEKRATGFQNVLLVGTGTGLAPFAAMIKQLHYEALQGKADQRRFTLLHANRTYNELAYHLELSAIEAANKFDFVYVPTVSRPDQRDLNNPAIGKGRATNLLRRIFEMRLKEEEDVENAASDEQRTKARAALEKAVTPALPSHISPQRLLERLDPEQTVILTCGNPKVMSEIKTIADTNHIHLEKEDW